MGCWSVYLLQGVRLLYVYLAWQFVWTWLAVVVTVTLGYRWLRVWPAWCRTT